MVLHKDHFLSICVETFQQFSLPNRRYLTLIALCQVSMKRINNDGTTKLKPILEILFSSFSVNVIFQKVVFVFFKKGYLKNFEKLKGEATNIRVLFSKVTSLV